MCWLHELRRPVLQDLTECAMICQLVSETHVTWLDQLTGNWKPVCSTFMAPCSLLMT